MEKLEVTLTNQWDGENKTTNKIADIKITFKDVHKKAISKLSKSYNSIRILIEFLKIGG